MVKKVLVFGIDGGNYRTLKPWMDNGSMPFLKSFLSRNFSKEILCEIDGAPGWPTFITGKYPKNHLAYYWMGRNYHSRKNNFIVNSNFLGKETLWSILSNNDIKMALINVPITYPPFEINGFVISGPGGGLQYRKNLKITYPDFLLEEIKSNGIDYRMKWHDVNTLRRSVNFIENITKATESHINATNYLLDKYELDFTMLVFRGHDAIQHRAYKLIEGKLINNYPKLYSAISMYYQIVDKGMQEIYTKIKDKNTQLLTTIVSDHGFGPCDLKVNIDQFFKKNNWLSFDYLAIIPKILNKFKIYSIQNDHGFIDIKKTKVYRDSTNSISINVRGRDPFGIVAKQDYKFFRKDVISFMWELSHPSYGKIFKNINTPDQLDIKNIKMREYEKFIPDIIFIPNDNIYISGGFNPRNFSEYNKAFYELDNESFYNWTGTHRKMGLFSIEEDSLSVVSSLKKFDLTQIAPTILEYFNITKPNWMDGNSII